MKGAVTAEEKNELLRAHANPRKRALAIAILLAPVLALVAATAMSMRANPTEAWRTFSVPGDERALKLLSTVTSEMEWKLIDFSSRRREMSLRFETPPTLFARASEVDVTVTAVDSSHVMLRVQSSSRSWLSGSRTNRRRIHELFDRIDEKLRE